IGLFLASPEGCTLLTTSCEEVVTVARAAGAPLHADAARSVIEEATTLPPQWRSSMARDLDDGRRLEVDALSGAVVRRGREHGLPTSVHQAIAACLSLHQPTTAEPGPTPAPAVVRA